MSIFNKSITLIDIATLCYPATSFITLEKKIKILKSKKFEANNQSELFLQFVKHDSSEVITMSKGYHKIDIPEHLKALLWINNNDLSWISTYTTANEEQFYKIIKQGLDKFLWFYKRSSGKTIIYFKIKVRSMAADVVVLEAIENHKDRTFTIRAFLAIEDYDSSKPYDDETLNFPTGIK